MRALDCPPAPLQRQLLAQRFSVLAVRWSHLRALTNTDQVHPRPFKPETLRVGIMFLSAPR